MMGATEEIDEYPEVEQINDIRDTNKKQKESSPKPKGTSSFQLQGFEYGQPAKVAPSGLSNPGFNFNRHDKKRTASLPANVYIPRYPIKGSFANFSIHDSQNNEEKDFKPVDQFRISLNEVVKVKQNNRIFN